MRSFVGPFRTEQLKRCAHAAGVDALAQKPMNVCARIREQHVIHERDRRRRPFDVEQNRSDVAFAKTECHAPASGRAGGKYVAPKQTG